MIQTRSIDISKLDQVTQDKINANVGKIVSYTGSATIFSDLLRDSIDVSSYVPQFDPNTDLLQVFKNSTYQPIDTEYTMSGSVITKVSGMWGDQGEDDILDFVVIKSVSNIPLSTFSGTLINEGTIGKSKLTPSLQEEITNSGMTLIKGSVTIPSSAPTNRVTVSDYVSTYNYQKDVLMVFQNSVGIEKDREYTRVGSKITKIDGNWSTEVDTILDFWVFKKVEVVPVDTFSGAQLTNDTVEKVKLSPTLRSQIDDATNEIGVLSDNVVYITQFPKLALETDDTYRIDRATDYLEQNGGGKLELSKGEFITKYIKIKKNVIIEGKGYGTSLKYANNTNAEAFIYLKDGQVSRAGLRNIKIDGNKANNTTGHCIKVDGSAYVRPDDFTPDNNLNFENIWIIKAPQHGLYLFSGREARLSNIMVCMCGDKGILLGGSDHFLDNITSYWNIGIGIHITGPNNKMSNIKAFGNRGACGIYFDSTGIENIGVNIEAQENYGHGIMIGDSFGITLTNVLADANSYTNPNTSNGIHIYNSDRIIVTGHATDFHKKRNDGQWYQKSGINLYHVSNYNIIMNVDNQMTSDYSTESVSQASDGLMIINGKHIKSTMKDYTWVVPTLSNVTAWNDGEKPIYMKDSVGMVSMQGAINVPSSGNQNTLIFTLPSGYRPNRFLDFSTSWGKISIDYDGSVTIKNAVAVGYFPLNINFRLYSAY